MMKKHIGLTTVVSFLFGIFCLEHTTCLRTNVQGIGVDEYIPEGILNSLFHPLKGMGNPFRAVLHPIQSLRILFSFVENYYVEFGDLHSEKRT